MIPVQINRVAERIADAETVIACALAEEIDGIVSADMHSSNLNQYQGIRIIDAVHALHSFSRQCSQDGSQRQAPMEVDVKVA